MNDNNILVVEDDEMIAEVMTDILTALGYNLDIAPSGPAALKLLKHKEYKLAIIDLELPAMPGIEVAQKIVAAQRDVRVLFTTGYSDQEEQIDLSEPHFIDVIRKPFDIADLQRAIENALNTP